jgi:hypothetical protein
MKPKQTRDTKRPGAGRRFYERLQPIGRAQQIDKPNCSAEREAHGDKLKGGNRA